MNDTVWQNLHILRNLKLHEKLNTADNVFSVSSPGWWAGAQRRWNGERRSVNIGRLQDQFEIALLRIEREPIVAFRYTMSQQVQGGMKGLVQLKLTYAEDAQAVSQLLVLEQQIEQRLRNVDLVGAAGAHAPSPPESVVGDGEHDDPPCDGEGQVRDPK